MAMVTARRTSTPKKKAMNLKVGKTKAGKVKAGSSWFETVAKAMGKIADKQSE